MSTTEKASGPSQTAVTLSTSAMPTKTEYLVLARVNDAWAEGGKFSAANSHAAIKAYLDGYKGPTRDALVAVPARSWQPVKPKTTTKTITTLEAL